MPPQRIEVRAVLDRGGWMVLLQLERGFVLLGPQHARQLAQALEAAADDAEQVQVDVAVVELPEDERG